MQLIQVAGESIPERARFKQRGPYDVAEVLTENKEAAELAVDEDAATRPGSSLSFGWY